MPPDMMMNRNMPMRGDRVKVVVAPHMEGHDVGIVRQVVDGALGIEFDAMPGAVHQWYVPSEVMVIERSMPSGSAGDPGDEMNMRRSIVRSASSQPHAITRILRAFAGQPWFIDPREAEKIVSVLMVRGMNGPRAVQWPRSINELRAEAGLPPVAGGDKIVMPYGARVAAASERAPARDRRDNIVVLNLQGLFMPRSADDISGPPAASLERFNMAFDQAATSPDTGAIVLNIDSPGGAVDLVPETAAKIAAARDSSRPIIAVANTMVASAAYWIAAAADELVVTESGEVGSIGVWSMHEDMSEALAAEGVKITLISEGARKVEGNPFEPLSTEARKHLQNTTRHYYDMFVRDVAMHREVDETVVRADPEGGEAHFGGGRTYPARIAVKLGMADKVESLESVLRSLQTGKRPIRNRRPENSASRGAVDMRRRRLALI